MPIVSPTNAPYLLTVGLDIPERFRAYAVYALRALALRWGVPLRLVPTHMNPDLLYADAAAARLAAGLTVRLDETVYAASTPCRPRVHHGDILWTTEGAEPDGHDPIGATYRLLALLDEQQVPESQRGHHGVFLDTALPAARREVAAVPLVEYEARALWRRLAAAGLGVSRAQRSPWPDGKRVAVVLSHDVDALHLGAASELAVNVARGFLRRDWRYLALFAVGLRYVGRFRANPYLGFQRWRAWEHARSARSAFYLFARGPGVPHDRHDCRSSVETEPVNWPALRALADQGWEFGLHASINSWRHAARLGGAKRWIEERLERPVRGVRHHYLSIDWCRPHLTFREQIAAGFSYDSSLGWRNRAGFRSGTSLPFEPFDPATRETLALLELPLTAMDNHLAGRGIHAGKRVGLADRLDEGIAAARQVREVGGMAVLNWHQEVIWDRLVHRGARGVLGTMLAELLEGGDAWLATPCEVTDYWRRRSRALLPIGSGFEGG